MWAPLPLSPLYPCLQLRDFLLVYNRMTELCFQRCVPSLFQRALDAEEEACLHNCAGKLMHSNHRLMAAYVQLMPALVHRRIADYEAASAGPDRNFSTRQLAKPSPRKGGPGWTLGLKEPGDLELRAACGKSQLDSEVPGEKTFQKRSTGSLPQTSLLSSQVMTILKTEKYLKKIHFLYLNVAPSRYFSETMTLGTWHRHSVLWEQLQVIPFFKYCLLRKAFTCWQKSVKLQGLLRRRAFLGKHLLFAELHSVCWLPQELDRSYELLDLQRALASENHKALRLLHRCLRLCTSILQLIHEDTYHMQQGLQEQVKSCKRIRTDQRSIYLQKVQCRQLEQKLRQAEAWLLQLGLLARLVGYMICQSLVSIIEKEMTSFVANILQAPRQKPFLSAQLVFDSCGQLTHEPYIENMIEILTGGLQSVKASALKAIQSTDLKTWDSLYSEEDEEEDSNTEFMMPKLQGQPSDAVGIFCGPNIGLLWPWKSRTITKTLEVRGHRLRGQFLPPNYKQLQEDLDNNPRILQALTIQQTLLQGTLTEVQEFCRKHQWLTDIYEFLQAWGPQKLESMRGCPIKSYVMLVSCLNVWQARVSNTPVQVITKDRLLLLSCSKVQAEMGWHLALERAAGLLASGGNTFCLTHSPLSTRAQHKPQCVAADGTLGWFSKSGHELMVWLPLQPHSYTGSLALPQLPFFLMHCLTPNPLPSSESKLASIRKDIFVQVQSECRSRSQQLITELSGFMEVFQTISSDIHTIAQCSQKLNEANEQYTELEEQVEYIRSLYELIHNHFSLFSAENEALDISLLDVWEAFKFEKSQASELLLSKQHAIVPKLQQLMAAALTELEGLLEKALSGPFVDPAQEQRSTEHQLIALERQFQSTVSHLSELHRAYATVTGTVAPLPSTATP
ncbi:hypothetical protein MC885_015136 [Smutsia gigantea]|nr:hypothetical protein MC885_015136 [Smutsia gigantea]